MSAATWLAVGGESLLMTSLLVAIVLLIRRPVARHFGPHLAYALWAVPLLRAILPPMPVTVVVPATEPAVLVPLEFVDAAAPAATPSLLSEIAAISLPLLALIWLAGAAFVIGYALRQHGLYRQRLLENAIDLDPVGGIRLVISDAVPGPVSLGLRRRIIAVPTDFFARYDQAERRLAMRHEIAHHRSGDLWANAAALLLLASQWFNPLAWIALRAFRFDQEAACDARVLAASPSGEPGECAAIYARTLAKTAIGPRLILATPMAAPHGLKERLIMLSQTRPAARVHIWGRLLLGAGGLAAMLLTASALPITVARAADPVAEPSADAPIVERSEERVVIVTSDLGDGEDAEHADSGGEHRQVHRIVIGPDGAPAAPHGPEGDGAHKKRVMHFRMPGGLSRDDILATLKEQGIDDAKANAIADKLEARRKDAMVQRFSMPMPAMPPMPPLPSWAPTPPMPPAPPMPPTADWGASDASGAAPVACPKGMTPKILVNRADGDGPNQTKVKFITCAHATPVAPAKQIAALKKTRDRFVAKDAASRISPEMRAKVVADLDRAIADLETKSQ